MDLASLIQKKALEYGVPPELVKAVLMQESFRYAHAKGVDPSKAVSPAGAAGLGQLMPETAKALGVTDRADPVQNVTGTVKLLKEVLDRYGGNVSLALADYNAGIKAVRRAGNKVPPIAETQNYVRTVSKDYQDLITKGTITQQGIMDKYLGTATGVTPVANASPVMQSPVPASTLGSHSAPYAPMPPAPPQPQFMQAPAPQVTPSPAIVPAQAPNVVDYTSQMRGVIDQMGSLKAPTVVSASSIPQMSTAELTSMMDKIRSMPDGTGMVQPAIDATNRAIAAQGSYANNIAGLNAGVAANANAMDYGTYAQQTASALMNQQAQGDKLIAAAQNEVLQNDAKSMSITQQLLNQQNFNPLNPNSQWNRAVADQRHLLNVQRATERAQLEMQNATMFSNPALWAERMLLGNTYAQGSQEVDGMVNRLSNATTKVTDQLATQDKFAQAAFAPRHNVQMDTLQQSMGNLALGSKAQEILAKAPLDQAAANISNIMSQAQLQGQIAGAASTSANLAGNATSLQLQQLDLQQKAALAPLDAAGKIAGYQTAIQGLANSQTDNNIKVYEAGMQPLNTQMDGIKTLANLQNNNLNAQVSAQQLRGATNQNIIQEATMPTAISSTTARQSAEAVKAKVEEGSANVTLGVQQAIGTPQAISASVKEFTDSVAKAEYAREQQKYQAALMPLQDKAAREKLNADIRTEAKVAEANLIQAEETIKAQEQRVAQQVRLKAALMIAGGTGAVPEKLDVETVAVLEQTAQNAGFTGKDVKDAIPTNPVLFGNNTYVAIKTLNTLGLNSPNNPKYPAIANASTDLMTVIQNATSGLSPQADQKEIEAAYKNVSQKDIEVKLTAEANKVRDAEADVPKSNKVYGLLPTASTATYIGNPKFKALAQQNALAIDEQTTYGNKIMKLIEISKDLPPQETTLFIADYFRATVDANNSLRGYELLGVPKQTSVKIMRSGYFTSDIAKTFDLTSPADVARLRNLSTRDLRDTGGARILGGGNYLPLQENQQQAAPTN